MSGIGLCCVCLLFWALISPARARLLCCCSIAATFGHCRLWPLTRTDGLHAMVQKGHDDGLGRRNAHIVMPCHAMTYSA